MIRALVAVSLALASCEYLDMGLPTSREETATPASPISSNTINAIQDAIIGNKKPSLTRTFFPALLVAQNISLINDITIYWISTAGSAFGSFAIPADVGDRITGITINLMGDGAADVTAMVVRAISSVQSSTATILYNAADNNRAAAWSTVDLLPFTPHVVAAGEAMYLDYGPNAAGYRIGNVNVTYDRL